MLSTCCPSSAPWAKPYPAPAAPPIAAALTGPDFLIHCAGRHSRDNFPTCLRTTGSRRATRPPATPSVPPTIAPPTAARLVKAAPSFLSGSPKIALPSKDPPPTMVPPAAAPPAAVRKAVFKPTPRRSKGKIPKAAPDTAPERPAIT